MPENNTPASYFGSGYSQLTDTDEFIRIMIEAAAFAEGVELASVAEAHPTTGDAKNMIFALCEHWVRAHEAIPIADRPAFMSLTRRLGYDTELNPTRTYTFTFTMSPETNPTVKATV